MTTETGNLPDLGAQVRPLLQAVPPRVQPRLVAELERAAADRYEVWAAQCWDEAQANGLRECADREREVARRVEALVAPEPHEARHFRESLPRIAAAYDAALANRPVTEQYAIQAAAERRGAAFWRALAASLPDPPDREVLAICAGLEERSAESLEGLLAWPS